MAENGKMCDSISSALNKGGSETAFDFHCDLCYKDNTYVEAAGYCADCTDYLCQECYNYHLKPRPMRHHVLLDQHRMPKATSQKSRPMGDHVLLKQYGVPNATSKDMCTEPCAEHKNKTLEYYCADHKKFGCGVCMTLHHRNCEGVDYIPDIAGDVLTSIEYKDMSLKLRGLINTAQQTIKTTQLKTQISNQQHSDASEFFKQLKKDLIAAVDRIETLTMTDAKKIRDENQKKMKSVEDRCNQLLKDIGTLDSTFTSLENKGQHCQIFFFLKRSQDEIASLETSLLQLHDQRNITEYVVKMSDDLQNLIQRPKNMASLEMIKDPQTSSSQVVPSITVASSDSSDNTKPFTKPQPVTASTVVRKREEHKKTAAVHVVDIDVSMEDKDVPCITGSVVLPGDKLVIVDRNNNTVKLINLQSNKIVAHLKYYGGVWNSGLWDITAVTNRQIAVTSPDGNTILFINVTKSNWIFNETNTLTLDHKVKVKGVCRGIANIRDNLVITYRDPPKVEIISQKGELLQTLVTEDRGRQLFTNPQYVAVSPDQQTLYISDFERGTVTSLDLNGKVKATYKNKKLSSPRGMTIDGAGVLYVCGIRSHNIHQLTPDLHKIQILLQQSDGIWYPQSVSYNEEQKKLNIGMSDSVKMYQLQ